MVPAISSGGRTFKAAALYFLHDTPAPGQARYLSSGRVAWTRTFNLTTDDPHRAWRMMVHTAECQAALKKAAGIKATGRKLERPTFAYSLAWHPDETPAQAEMLDAARQSLKALGLEEHQAIVIAHSDTRHSHLHILVNRVHPYTGLAARLSKSKLILSAWAQGYEEGRGRVFCPDRVENNARRRGLKPGCASDNHSRREPWPVVQAGGSRRPATAALMRDHADRFSAQAGVECQGQRRRRAENAAFHQERRAARASIHDRDRTERYIKARPELAAEASRLADALARGDAATVFDALTRYDSTFTRHDLARLAGRHTATVEAFTAAMAQLEASPELIRLGRDARGRERYTTQGLQAIERRMMRAALTLQGQSGRRSVSPRWADKRLSPDQDAALRHILKAPQLAAVVGFAGTGKSTMLEAARLSWEAAGYRVHGAALSGIAADGLKNGAGIDSRTIHSRLFQWDNGKNKLTARDVLVIDEAGMVGSRQMERLLSHAVAVGAKIVLVGDHEQLQSIEAGGAFRAIVGRIGAAGINTVRRQKEPWQQAATVELATGRGADALKRYEAAGMIHAHARQADAMAAVIAAWDEARTARPTLSQIVLAYTRHDVRQLNDMARAKLKAAGALGPDAILQTAQGNRAFAAGDRIYFLRNDTGLNVRNGSLGIIERIEGKTLAVRLDGEKVRRVTVRLDRYNAIDHGYAATIHKSQGVTVDRAHLLVSRNLDRHSFYVAMTRHRDRVDAHWSGEAIGSRRQLERLISRAALKDTSLDYDPVAVSRDLVPAGRVANARSPAGSGAGLIALARLAFNPRGRAKLFQRQQAAVRRQAQKPESVTPSMAALSGPYLPAPSRKVALIEHAEVMANRLSVLMQRHGIEAGREKDARRMLQAIAASNWRHERQAVKTEARYSWKKEQRIPLVSLRQRAWRTAGLSLPSQAPQCCDPYAVPAPPRAAIVNDNGWTLASSSTTPELLSI